MHGEAGHEDLPVPMSGAVATAGLGRSASQPAACPDNPLLEGKAGFKRAAHGTGLGDALGLRRCSGVRRWEGDVDGEAPRDAVGS